MRTLGFTLALAILLSASLAFASCPPIPKNDVWGSVSHGAIVDYVARSQDFNWDAYIEKWEDRLTATQRIQERNSVLVFHNTGTWLKGEDLAAYVADIRERITVTRCVAAKTKNEDTLGPMFAGSVVGDGS